MIACRAASDKGGADERALGGTRRLLAQASTATLTTQLFKRGFRNTFIQGVRRLTPCAPVMVGEAYLLRMIPAREDLDHSGMFSGRDHPQRRAIEECPAGKVLVIDCRGKLGGGSLGDILIARLMTARRRRRGDRRRDSRHAAGRAHGLPGLCRRAAAPASFAFITRSTSTSRSAAARSRSIRATCWSATARAWS